MVGAAWLAFALLNLGVLLTASEPLFHGAGFTRLSGRAAEAGAVVAFCLHSWPRIKAASTPKGER
jgi:hypothetical protein